MVHIAYDYSDKQGDCIFNEAAKVKFHAIDLSPLHVNLVDEHWNDICFSSWSFKT